MVLYVCSCLNLSCIMLKALCSLAFLACVLGVDLGGSLSCFFLMLFICLLDVLCLFCLRDFHGEGVSMFGERALVGPQ